MKVETARKSVSVNCLSLGVFVSRVSLTIDVTSQSLNLYTSFRYPLITIDLDRCQLSELAEANVQDSAKANVQDSAKANVQPYSITMNQSTQTLDFELRLLSEVAILT